MRLKNERPRLSKTVDDVVATIRMTLRNYANKYDEFYGTPFGSKLITSVIRSNFLDRRNFLTDHLHSTLYLIRSCGFDTKFFLMGLNRWLMIDRSIIRRSITDLDHSMGNEVVRG